MLSKSKIRLIRSLELKKNRLAERLFVAEGKKMVFDLIESHLSPFEVFCTKDIAAEIVHVDSRFISVVVKDELKRISSFKSAPEIIALFRIPEVTFDWNEITNDLTLVLDAVQDPGNLGTIVRTADWFGIKNIICSKDSVDLYNSKTVQSTMGAIGRVKVHYLELKNFLSEARKQEIPIYGTFMEGENLFTTELTSTGIIVMGNEGKGISKELEDYFSGKISIPRFPAINNRSESLNVAVAASIICAEFRRRFY